MYTKKEFLKLLKSKRELFAYVVINSDSGLNVKQNKTTWIESVNACDESQMFDALIEGSYIFIN
jgi:hypothetical protein